MSRKRPGVALANIKRAKPIRERFDSKTDKNGPVHPVCGRCWIWTGSSDGNGYGCLVIKGKSVGAHRVSYNLHAGEIPTGQKVLHHCDTPKCVNPSHLFLGTDADNNADMVAKGRNKPQRGSDNGNAILTDDDVRDIKRLYRKGVRGFGAASLGKRYGVSDYAIFNIVRGTGWKHLS